MSTQAVIVYQSRAHEAMGNILSAAAMYNHKSKKMIYSDSARTGIALAVSLFGAICTVYFM